MIHALLRRPRDEIGYLSVRYLPRNFARYASRQTVEVFFFLNDQTVVQSSYYEVREIYFFSLIEVNQSFHQISDQSIITIHKIPNILLIYVLL